MSQPSQSVDVTSEGARTQSRNTAAFLGNSGVVSSPVVIQESDGEAERPAKRARTEHQAPGGAEDGSRDGRNDIAYLIVPGSPLPVISRPARRSNTASAGKGPWRAVLDRAACRANGLEPPIMATRLPPPKKVADFAPWNGSHPEDILSETVVKAGYFDKPPGPNSTESNSAKPMIWPNLSQKNNMGLQTLSYLFTQVMEKRQVMGKCTAPSTFKPPPRVTVTDTKREAWLRDLSNPDVPLRKQSRTIPHGIRGKLLMEQCLSKDIPMPRAVWLAKCVGANELRAFRRKGVSGAAAASGEGKWVTEWTVHIEQFLEGVIASCGQPQWQAKMNYAVKLATSFYTERLLDRDHYLDWIVSCFAQASSEALPVWVIMVQLYWQDVVAFVRRGRKLAQAILEILYQSCQGSLLLGDVLGARLKKLVMVMAVAHRCCLIIPKTWEKYSHLLAPDVLGAEHATLEEPIQNLSKRNIRLTRPLRKTPEGTRSALVDLYATLDTTNLHTNMEGLTTKCLAWIAEVCKLVPALLSWSASVYRTGDSRVYLAAGILSQLHKRGYDTDEAVIVFLRSQSSVVLQASNVYRVIAELIRADCFSPGRYMQWLMTSGALSGGSSCSFSNDLLVALPLDALPPHLLNSRNMLLRRLGNFKEETGSIKATVARTLFEESDDLNTAFSLIGLSGSAKMAVAREISLKTAERAKLGTITLQGFCKVRTILESCGDHRALADIVQSASHTDDPSLLATLTDTVSMHARSFGALGCLHFLLCQLLERYNALRSQQPLDRRFILALTSLTKRFPEKKTLVGHLEQDLAICEQQNSMNVCSPASDSIVSMHASNLASDSDIDAVFASGNNMDEQLMQRVFARIVQRARKATSADAQYPSKVCGWLEQLRAAAVDLRSFDQMATRHVRACLNSAEQAIPPCNIISALVASGCTPFACMVEEAKTPPAASTMVRILTSSGTIDGGLHAAEAYQYRVQQQLYCSAHSEKVIHLFIAAMDCSDVPLEDQSLLDLVLDYTVAHHNDVVKSLASQSWSPVSLANCSRLVMKVLSLGRRQNTDGQLDAHGIVAIADALSVAYCSGALKLQSMLSPERSNEVQQAVLEAIASGSEVWPQLLESIGKDIIHEVYRWARDEVMSQAFEPDVPERAGRRGIDRSLDILDVTFHAARQDDSGAIITTITEKLKEIDAHLLDATLAGPENGYTLRTLRVLLHLIVLYSTSSETGKDGLDQSRGQLLASLSTILVHPKLRGSQELLEYIYDVASAVADTLPEAILCMLTRSITSKDSILPSLFGSRTSPDAWLAITSHPQPQGSQQQRALLKPAGGQPQLPGRQSQQQSPVQQHGFQRPPVRADVRPVTDVRMMPFPLRRWEIMSDATPIIGDNDTSLSLGLFGARKV